MADNFNTFKNIGDTVSFDSLYRGIENMGKAIASARAAKAKANAKSNDELQKMILTLDQQKGLTSLQAQKNKNDYANALQVTLEAAKTDPNTTLSTFLTAKQDYNAYSNMAVDQSKVEEEIRRKAGEGLISASVLDLYNQATKDGNMLPFLNPNVQLELNRQGIYVVPDPNSEAELTDGTKAPIWAFVSAPSLAKPKSIVDEFTKIKNDPSNYTSTVSSVKTPTKIKGVFDNAVTETFTIKPEKVTELKEQLASDVGIQSLYRTDNELWTKKTLLKYEEINQDQTLQNLSQEEKLKLAAKRAIQQDIDDYNKNGLFNYDKKNLGTVTERADSKIIINNKQNVIDRGALGAGQQMRYVKGAAANEAMNTTDQVNAIAAKLKANGDRPVIEDFNGRKVVYTRVRPGVVMANYLDEVNEQTAGFQIQKRKQGTGAGEFLYTPGDLGSEQFYDQATLSPVKQSEVSKIMKKGSIDEYVKINGKVYAKFTSVIEGNKGISIDATNAFYVYVRPDSELDRNGASMYENQGGKTINSMYKWDGWNAEQNNAPVFK